MDRVIFHAANVIAMLVFYILYIAMIWVSAEMADYIAFSGSIAWALWAETGFLAVTVIALALFIVAAHNSFIRGPRCKRGKKPSVLASRNARMA